jgi:hypothetical protein
VNKKGTDSYVLYAGKTPQDDDVSIACMHFTPLDKEKISRLVNIPVFFYNGMDYPYDSAFQVKTGGVLKCFA